VRSGTLEGTSFSIATASALPPDLSVRVRTEKGDYAQGSLALIAVAPYSGDGEFVGIDGRFLMIPYEVGLMVRADLLDRHGRLDDALSRFEPHAQPPRHADDFLELALLHLMKQDGPKAFAAVKAALDAKPGWPFAMQLHAQMQHL